MKIVAMFAAGALAAGTLFAAAPADAQRHGWDGPRGGPGWHGPRGGPGWHGNRDWRGGRGWHNGRRWDGPRYGYRGGYRGGYGYRGPRGYGHSRVVCRIERGYYGPVRRCFRR